MELDPCEMFRVLGAGTRLAIIELLKSRGPIGAKSIAEVLDITPAAVSQHLKVLRQAGLVRSERKGYWIPYSIDEEALEHCRCMLNEVCTCGCEATCRLEEELDSVGLASLIKYEKQLEDELRNIRERISKIAAQGE